MLQPRHFLLNGISGRNRYFRVQITFDMFPAQLQTFMHQVHH